MRVLVVEDQQQLRQIIYSILEEDGYAVDVASDGSEGLLKSLSTDYDAIVLDLMLPGLDGLSLLHKLRRTKSTPVLILSARDQLGDRVGGLDQGADDYLVKPFEKEELLARLRALIRRAAGAGTTTIEFGDVRIDLRSKVVTLHDEPVELTAREYAVIAYLGMHRGKVVSKADLHEHVFDEIDDVTFNTIEVYISYLRKKLGAAHIETRRGLGYVIP